MVSSPLAALKIKYKHVKGTYSKLKVAQSCLTLCDPMDYTVHGILQARILEWVAFPFSRGIFPIQGSNLGLLHCRWILYQLSYQGSPSICCCAVTESCLIPCDPMDCSIPGFPVLHYLLEFAQTHVHWVSDAIQPSHPLSLPSLPALNLSQHQSLFQWVGSSWWWWFNC